MAKYLFLDIDGVINSERSFQKYSKQWAEASVRFRGKVEQYMETEMEKIISSGFRYGKLHLSRAKAVKRFGIGVEGGSKADPIAVENLNALCKPIPDLKIIISSTWRVGSTIEELQEIFNLWGLKYPHQIVGKTADSFDRPRDNEISDWISLNGIDLKNEVNEDRIAILDDMEEMCDLNRYLIQTNPAIGFSKRDFNRLLVMFDYFPKTR
jgi:hypothetical protein